jgi:hypothetical protein
MVVIQSVTAPTGKIRKKRLMLKPLYLPRKLKLMKRKVMKKVELRVQTSDLTEQATTLPNKKARDRNAKPMELKGEGKLWLRTIRELAKAP